jgi:ribosomal protein S27AE
MDWKNRDDVVAYNRAWRAANKERIRAYEKARGMLPKNVALRAEYGKTEAGKKANTKHTGVQRERNPERYKANTALTNAVRLGYIIKPEICSRCGDGGIIDGHHADYSKPLEVEWLCRACHTLEHRK